MIEEEIPKDLSLLRCTLKKSVSVGKKWLLVAACTIDVLALAVILTIIVQYSIPFTMFFVERVLAFVDWVPLWARIIIGAIVLLVGYSFLWCVNRDLTDADYKSDCADAGGIMYIIISIVLFIIGMILLGYSGKIIFFVFVIPMLGLMFELFWSFVCDEDMTLHIRFPGAVINHYLVDKVEVKKR